MFQMSSNANLMNPGYIFFYSFVAVLATHPPQWLLVEEDLRIIKLPKDFLERTQICLWSLSVVPRTVANLPASGTATACVLSLAKGCSQH